MLPPGEHPAIPCLLSGEYHTAEHSWSRLHECKFEIRHRSGLWPLERRLCALTSLSRENDLMPQEVSQIAVWLLLFRLRVHVLCLDDALGRCWQPVPLWVAHALLVARHEHHPLLHHCQLRPCNMGLIPVQGCWCPGRDHKAGCWRVPKREKERGKAFHAHCRSRCSTDADAKRSRCRNQCTEVDADKWCEPIRHEASLWGTDG